MTIVSSLLNAILRLDGEALVMHVGEKPYVVAPAGQVELATRPLNFDAVSGMVSQLLPVELQHALDEFGAVQYEFPAITEFPGEHFSVVAARGGEDVWVEVRRRRIPDDDRIPPEFFAPVPPEPVAAAVVPAVAPAQREPVRPIEAPRTEAPRPAPVTAAAPVAAAPAAAPIPSGPERVAVPPQPVAARWDDVDLDAPEIDRPVAAVQPVAAGTDEPAIEVELEVDTRLESPQPEAAPAVAASSLIDHPEPVSVPTPTVAEASEPIAAPEPQPVATAPVEPIAVPAPQPVATAPVEPIAVPAPQPEAIAPVEPIAVPAPQPVATAPVEPIVVPVPQPEAIAPVEPIAVPEPQPVGTAPVEPIAAPEPQPVATAPVEPIVVPVPQPVATAPPAERAIEPTPTIEAVEPAAPAEVAPEAEPPAAEAPAPLAAVTGFVRPTQPAVVLPISRSPIRPEGPPPSVPAVSGLDRLLRLAAARGASALYLTSQAEPSLRVDGEIQGLSGEPPLSPGEVEALLLDLMPERNREELRSGIATEWICDVPDVGRVRCMTFRDHRGAGGIFRMMPVRAISADQLGLSREIQALAAEPEGFVLVAGPRSSGKSMLMAAFVDLINRTRRDHVITIESEIKVVHERRGSLVSQREVRGTAEEMLAVVRGAIRENPDVMVVEELRSADLVTAALEAAGSGHLVIGALPAHTATAAVDRIIDLYPPEERRHVQLSLAETLRGIVAQVLVRKRGGGRVAAREVLLNTPAVAGAVAEGKTSQLPLAIEGGRKYGMVPLNDALAGLVQNGTVDAREAYRRAADRAGFLALLKRQGIDTSFVERLA